jgi:acylglycerol lipase
MSVPVGHSEAYDETIASTDATPLKAWSWQRTRPRGVLVIAHGLGEHGGCYRHVAEAIAPALEFDVLAFDFRGHGRSPGRRGFVRRFDDFTKDLHSALGWAQGRRPGLPQFVLGHSKGGLVALQVLLEGAVDIAGLVLSNPALRMARPVPRHKRWAGALLRRLAPGVTLPTDVEPEEMTRDPAVLAERSFDPLRHTRISSAIYYGMLDAAAVIARDAPAVRTPTLMILGGSDAVIDPSASRALFERLGSSEKTLQIYPEMLHEPLNDVGRDQVISDIVAWLAQRVSASRVGLETTKRS